MESNMEYPISRPRLLWKNNGAGSGRVFVPMTYQTEWLDGFGARGWKLDAAIRDHKVIASTSYAGEKIPTSVLVHDILDHFISGFGFSGHRNEAMATAQLGLRTGTEIRSSYALMVEEIMRGEVEGEQLDTFLPLSLKPHLPAEGLAAGEQMRHVADKLGMNELRSILLSHFYEIGLAGVPRAIAAWRRHGLDYNRRAVFGICLQGLLVRAESWLLGPDSQHAIFSLANERCTLEVEGKGRAMLPITMHHGRS